MFGDATANSEFTTVDIDSKSNVILGGFTRSTSVCNCSAPLITYFKAGAQSQWARVLSQNN